MRDLKEIPQDVTEALTSLGLDLYALGRTEALPENSPLRAPGATGGRALLLIGNNREMWNVFVRALRFNPDLLKEEHPLDSWLCRTIPTLLENFREQLPGHRRDAADHAADRGCHCRHIDCRLRRWALESR